MNYKWIALSNTTLGVILVALDSSIVLVALPAVFRGIGVNPLLPGESGYLLWTIMGYLVVTSTLLVTVGRLSDMFGRTRLYNLGFLIFAIGSFLLYIIQGQGNFAAMQLIIYRLIQAVGGAFLFANSTAILTDAFPENQRGMALGINQIAFIAGQFFGLIIGGILAAIDWRMVFLISVPFSIGGTIWAYISLHETSKRQTQQKFDVLGNILFAGGLISILVGITYALQPYNGSSMGWTNPFVLTTIMAGLLALVVFTFVERKVTDPMFHLELFKNSVFASGNLAVLFSAIARGGLLFILVIWLQGVWLPLHGFNFEDTPLWAGIYMLPLTAGFLIMGPLSGFLSDRFGPRPFTVGGMLLAAIIFIGFLFVPVNFSYGVFAALLFILGLGLGVFFSPNTSSIMNSVPPEYRGIASGMRGTFQNTAMALSIAFIFSILIFGFAQNLPHALYQALVSQGFPKSAAIGVEKLPPTAALFAAFLGYNPLKTILPSTILGNLSVAKQMYITGRSFFPMLLITPLKDGLNLVFITSAILSLLAAIASFFAKKMIR